MNDSRRQSNLKNRRRCSLVLGAAALLIPISGCVNGDAFRSAQTNESDSGTMLAESELIQTDLDQTVQAVRTSVPTSLVSTTTAMTTIRPTIISLPSNANLQEQLADVPGPVLLDFYADWCGPCQKQSVILDEIEGAAARAETTIIKINVDKHRNLAQQLNVSSLPTLMMINDGQVTERQTGVVTRQRLASWMQ